jgi:hypothetical protein
MNALSEIKSDCDPPAVLGFGDIDQNIDTALDVSISCLLYDQTPSSFEYDYVPIPGSGDPISTPFVPSGFVTASEVIIDWDSPIRSDTVPTTGLSAQSPELLTETAWANNIGVLRVDLVPYELAAPLPRANLATDGYTFYLYPSTTAGYSSSMTIDPGTNGQGATLVTGCDNAIDPVTGFRCRGRVFLSVANDYYFMRIQSYYSPVRTSVTAKTDTGVDIEFKDGQVVIDSTGRANDVYRRLVVRVPVFPNASYLTGLHVPFSIYSTDSICKRAVGMPNNSFTDPSYLTIPACVLPIGGAAPPPPPPVTVLPPPPPKPQDCQDVNMPGTYFFRFERWPDPAILGYALQNHPDPPSTPLLLRHTVETPIYPLGFTLPAGRYNVWLYSWDQHTTPNTQTDERFYLRLYNGSTMVAQSSPISDMPNPDGSETRIEGGMYLVEQVNFSLVVTSPIDSIRARHQEPAVPPGTPGYPGPYPPPSGPYYASYPQDPFRAAHSSVKAVCASFTWVSD